MTEGGFANCGFTGRGKLSDFAVFQGQGCFIRPDSAKKLNLPTHKQLEAMWGVDDAIGNDFAHDVARSLVSQGVDVDSTIEMVPGDPDRNEMIIRVTPNKKEGE